MRRSRSRVLSSLAYSAFFIPLTLRDGPHRLPDLSAPLGRDPARSVAREVRRRGSGPRRATARAASRIRAPPRSRPSGVRRGRTCRAFPAPASIDSPPASTVPLPSTTEHEGVFLDLMVARALPGLEHDQDGAGRLVGVEDDGRAAPAFGLDLVQVPALHRRADPNVAGQADAVRLGAREPRRRTATSSARSATNCYVVSGDPRRSRGGRHRSGRRRGQARSVELERIGPRCDGNPDHPRRTGTTSAAWPTWPKRRVRPSTWPTTERDRARDGSNDFTPAERAAPALHARRPARGRRDARAGRNRVRDSARPRPLAGPPRVLRRRRALLGRRPLRGLGRPHRSAVRRLGDAGRLDPRCSPDRFPARRSSTPATGRRRRSAPSSSATRSSPSCAPSSSPRFEAPRGRTTSCRPSSRSGGGSRARPSALRALRLPPDPDARLRGHRALRPHVGRGLGRRPEGDVHLRGSRRPLADAACGGDGADLPGVSRARPASRAAAAEALHDRARCTATPRRRRAATASTSSSRSRRSAQTTRPSTPS